MSLRPSNYATLKDHKAMHNFTSKILTLLIGASLSIQTFAFGAGDDAPIKIQSDSAELNNQKGVSTYTGDVIIVQGDANLKADKVIIYSENNALVKIEAFGSPAHFSREKSLASPQTDGYGKTIIYNKHSQILKLLKEARLQQAQNSFTGDVIEYDTLKGIINAHGNTSSTSETKSRVEIEFHPNQINPAPSK